MGVQLKDGTLRGKVGSVVYRRWRNLNIVQGLPSPFKQTLASKLAASEFGKASSTARNLRTPLMPFFGTPDPTMRNRLTATVLRALRAGPVDNWLERDLHDGDCSILKGFEFNKDTPFFGVSNIEGELSMDEQGQAHVRVRNLSSGNIQGPGMKIKPRSVTLRQVVIAYNFREKFIDVLDYREDHVGYDDDEIRWEPRLKCSPNCLVLLFLALPQTHSGYNKENIVLHTDEWSPAAIASVAYSHAAERETLTVSQRIAQHEPEGGYIRFWDMYLPTSRMYDKIKWQQQYRNLQIPKATRGTVPRTETPPEPFKLGRRKME